MAVLRIAPKCSHTSVYARTHAFRTAPRLALNAPGQVLCDAVRKSTRRAGCTGRVPPDGATELTHRRLDKRGCVRGSGPDMAWRAARCDDEVVDVDPEHDVVQAGREQLHARTVESLDAAIRQTNR